MSQCDTGQYREFWDQYDTDGEIIVSIPEGFVAKIMMLENWYEFCLSNCFGFK